MNEFLYNCRENTCNVPQTHLIAEKKSCCSIFYCIFTLANSVFSLFLTKKPKNFRGLCPLNPHKGIALDPPDPQLLFYAPLARLFLLYYPLLLYSPTLVCLIVGRSKIAFFQIFHPQNHFINTPPPFYDFCPKSIKNLNFLGKITKNIPFALYYDPPSFKLVLLKIARQKHRLLGGMTKEMIG